MPSCAVKGCKSHNLHKHDKVLPENADEIRFFSFPKESQYRQKWIEFCKKDFLNLENARICSEHFEKDCYIDSYHVKKRYNYPIRGMRVLKKDAVPTRKPYIKPAPKPKTRASTSKSRNSSEASDSKTKSSSKKYDDDDQNDSETTSSFKPTLEKQFEELKEQYEAVVKERDELQKKIKMYEEKEQKMEKSLEKVLQCENPKARLTFEDISYMKIAELNQTYKRLKLLSKKSNFYSEVPKTEDNDSA